MCVTPIGYIASFEAWLQFLLFDISNILRIGLNAPGKENSLGGLDARYIGKEERRDLYSLIYR